MSSYFLLKPLGKGVTHALRNVCPDNDWSTNKKLRDYQYTLCDWDKRIGGRQQNALLEQGELDEVNCKQCCAKLKRHGLIREDV